MATTLFLTDTASDINPGANLEYLSGFARGNTAVSKATNTVAGPTAGVQVTDGAGGTAIEWFSPPLQAVTISGTITFNIRARESNMAANVGMQVRVERANGSGTVLSTIANSEQGVEVSPTAETAQNWTVTPTSTILAKGDRLKITVLGNDVGTMASTYTFTVWIDGPTGGATGDSYVTFNETLLQIVDITASITGTGSLSALATILVPIVASLSGSGTLTAVAAIATSITVSLSGTGALTGPITIVIPVAANLSGNGTLAAGAVIVIPFAANLTGTGAIAAAVVNVVPIGANLSGTGTLTAAAAIVILVAASLSGTGALAAAAETVIPIAASLTGTGSLSGDVTVIAGVPYVAPSVAPPVPGFSGRYISTDIARFLRPPIKILPRTELVLPAFFCYAFIPVLITVTAVRADSAFVRLVVEPYEFELLSELGTRTFHEFELLAELGTTTLLDIGVRMLEGNHNAFPMTLWGCLGFREYVEAERRADELSLLLLASRRRKVSA